MIVVNAHRINQGEFPLIKAEERKEATDFYFIQEEDPEKVLAVSLPFVLKGFQSGLASTQSKNSSLNPMHRGTIGVANLNLELQKMMNPDPAGIIHGSRTFKSGDKVMQIVNNYDKDVFNGDIGWVLRINREDREMTIDFDGG